MKGLSARVVRLLWDAHSVAGVVAGLLLHVMFFAGAIALFEHEALLWEQPALRGEGERMPRDLDRVVEGWRRARQEPLPRYFNLFLGDAWQPGVKATWGQRIDGQYVRHGLLLDAVDGTPCGGIAEHGPVEFMVKLHCFDFFPGGTYLSGVLGVVMLVAIVTGLAIHLRRWWTDFYRLRPGRSRRVAWADPHTVLGVLSLPFQGVLAFTGVFIAWSAFIYGAFALAYFGGNFTALRHSLRPEEVQLKAEGTLAAALPWHELIARARAELPAMEVEFFYVSNYGDAAATVVIGGTTPRVFFKSGAVTLRMRDGAVQGKVDTVNPPFAQWLLNAMAVLHFGTLGGWLLDALYVALSAITCIVCVSGLILWVEVRRNQHPGGPPAWHRWFERASIGAAAGLLPATALLFASWHALPAPVAQRIGQGQTVFFAAWSVAVLVALPQRSLRRTVQRMLGATVVLAAAVPVVNGMMTGGWLGTVPKAASTVDLAALCTAGGCAFVLAREGRKNGRRGRREIVREGLL